MLNSSLLLLWFLILCLVPSCCGWRSALRTLNRGLRLRQQASSPYIDISPQKDGKITKRIIQLGDFTKGKPMSNDCAEIRWRIHSPGGQLLHDSDMLDSPDKTFTFALGKVDKEVIVGWDIAVSDMYEGEISEFNITADLAFGEKGLLPYIEPNSDLVCNITLVKIIPSIERSFNQIEPDEDIQEELLQKIRSGHIPLPSKDNSGRPVAPPDLPTSTAKMFDPSKHKLNPNQRISGEGRDHNWEETITNIEIEIPLPAVVCSKADLEVRIRSKELYVKLQPSNEVLFSVPLFGGIVSSSAMWAIAADDPTNRFRGKRLVFSLEKAHGYRDIWASALDPKYIQDSTDQMQ